MYDVIIIGAGPGGYYLAERCGHQKIKALIFEKGNFGGTCLNVGCIPSKSLLYSAKVFHYAEIAKKYGTIVNHPIYKHDLAIKRKDEKVKILVQATENRVKKSGVEVVKGYATIVNRKDNIFTVECNKKLYQATYLVVATGSSCAFPPIKNLKEAYEKKLAVTNIEVLSLTKVPKKLLVIGGGVIGLEMAAYYNEVGSEIEIVEAIGNIAGPTDLEIANMLQKFYQKQGIKFHLNTLISEIDIKTKTAIAKTKSGETKKFNFDLILIATGRQPNTAHLGLENIGVEVERGIVIDQFCKTNVPNVFAIGDVKGFCMLAHAAYHEADVVIDNIMGKHSMTRYNEIPSVIYTNPEVASIGPSEEALKKDNIEYNAIKLPMVYSGRFLTENDDYQGLCKILYSKNGIILAFHLLGSYASEIISTASVILNQKMPITQVAKLIFPHPTVAEIIKEVSIS